MSMCSTSRQPRELCSNRISGSCCEIRAVSSFEQHELLWYQLQFTARRSEGLRCAVCGMRRHGCTRTHVHAHACQRACLHLLQAVPAQGGPSRSSDCPQDRPSRAGRWHGGYHR